jgi:cytosine/creatinine deaminase
VVPEGRVPPHARRGPPPGLTMLLRGARRADGPAADVRLAGDRVERLAPAGELEPRADEEALDLDGYVLLPAPAEPHAHLDKALSAELVGAAALDLPSAIIAWHAYRTTLQVEEIVERATSAARMLLARGATAVRTHVDVGPGIELRAAEALVGVRDALREVMDVQVVALSYPLTGAEGAGNQRRLREAADLGVDLIGGAPHIDSDPIGHLEACLAIAAEAGLPVDLHMDEHLSPELDLGELARMAAAGFANAVTASHCVSLGMQPEVVQEEVAAAVAAAGISVVTLPQTNLYLQGRELATATPRGLTAIAALRRAGAVVAGGGDNIQDPFNPLGGGDPLATAQLLVAAGHLDVAEAYRMVSDHARAAMGLEPGRVRPGGLADLLAIRAGSLREALATATEDRLVLHRGRLVDRTRVVHEPPGAGAIAVPPLITRQGDRHA